MPGNFTQTVTGEYVPEGARYSGAVNAAKVQMGGRRTRRSKKWIQGVMGKMKRGSFTREALRHHKTPEQYVDDVLAHPKRHTQKTLRRARLLKNIRR